MFSLRAKEKPAPVVDPEWVKTDRHYASSLYILDQMSKRDKKFERLVRRYVDVTQGLLQFEKMRVATAQWSMAHKTLVDLAAHLFNEVYPVKLADLDYLSAEEKEIVGEALSIRFGF